MKCLIVDDDLFARTGIRTVLNQLAAHIESLEAATGDEALAAVRDDPKSYQMIFLDLHLASGISGVQVLRTLKGELASETPVVVISADEDVRTVKEVFRNGAASYLLKSGSRDDEFHLAVREVLAGRVHIPQRLAAALLSEDGDSGADVRSVVEGLTEGQKVLLTWLTHGLANKAIGAKLKLGERRVKELVTELFSRFEVRTRALLLVKLSRHYTLPYSFAKVEEEGVPVHPQSVTVAAVRTDSVERP